MIINIPDYIIWLVVALVSIIMFFDYLGITSEVFLIYKIKKTGEFKTKKWIYTRVKREDTK